MRHTVVADAAGDLSSRTPGVRWFDADVAAIREKLPAREADRIKLLSDSRTEFYRALAIFYAQVRYSTSSIFAILAGTFAILKFAPDGQAKALALPAVLTPVGLVLGASLCIFFLVAAGGQYALYVSAVIFSAKLHFACGITGHAWFEWARIYADPPAKCNDDIIRRWMYSWTKGRPPKMMPNTFIMYAAVMVLLCVSCLVGCAYLFVARIHAPG